MRIKPAAALAFSLLWSTAYADKLPDAPPVSRPASEAFSSKVLKVYSFADADVEYTAYVVNWKDHEVVVVANGNARQTKQHSVGETIRCLRIHLPRSDGEAQRTRVRFVLSEVSEVDEARLEAIRAEIEARRAKRTKVAPAEQAK